MRRLAEHVYHLSGFPPYALNVYLIGDVIVDAGTRHAARRILREVRGRAIAAHALTHGHPAHQGSSHAICETLGIPLWCGASDIPLAEQPERAGGSSAWSLGGVIRQTIGGPGHPVARALRAGDDVAGFRVLEVPGHSPGSIGFWRELDRVLVIGDTILAMNPLTGSRGLREPHYRSREQRERNRASIRRLAALEPALVCFGHGPPLRDPARLAGFAAGLDGES